MASDCPCPAYSRERRSVLSQSPHYNAAGEPVFSRWCYHCGAQMEDHPVLEEGVAARFRGTSYLGGLALGRKLADQQEREWAKKLTHR